MTVNSVKPTDTVKMSATSCQLNQKKCMAQLIGKSCTVSCNINGMPVEMLLDSGAQVIMVSKTWIDRVSPHVTSVTP